MGILLKQGIPYVPPQNYESPGLKAKREYLEALKREEAERKAVDDELARLLFPKWIRDLSDTSKSEILTEKFGDTWDIVPEPKQNQSLNDYYNQYILPKELNKIQEGRTSM